MEQSPQPVIWIVKLGHSQACYNGINVNNPSNMLESLSTRYDEAWAQAAPHLLPEGANDLRKHQTGAERHATLR
ncbi:hypothetical protein WJX74_008402 [Apatococcus lobatus]|uniref:Uncharacterized protein n=2 Tax=Apatococcus TaxID=904362 RepID=A0AAW1T0C8_9CHLO